jgi:predicted branched-subunit amino acid permease
MSEWMGLEITLGLAPSFWACWPVASVLGLPAGCLLSSSNNGSGMLVNYSGWISMSLASFKRPISSAWNLGRANRLRCLVVRGDGAFWANHAGILCPGVHLVSSGFKLDRQ